MHPKYGEQPPANFQAAPPSRMPPVGRTTGATCMFPYSYSFYTSSSKGKARAELNRARATVFCGLHAADRTERLRTDIQIGHAIVGMVEDVSRRSANPEGIALLEFKAPVDGQRYDLGAGANHGADRRIAEAADVIRRFRERRRVHPLIDAPVRGI